MEEQESLKSATKGTVSLVLTPRKRRTSAELVQLAAADQRQDPIRQISTYHWLRFAFPPSTGNIANKLQPVTNPIAPHDPKLVDDPAFIRRLAEGIFVIVILAGPTVVTLSAASHLFSSFTAGSTVKPVLILPLISSGAVLALIYGFCTAIGAATVHSAIIGLFAHNDLESPWIAIGFGCAIGSAVPIAAGLIDQTPITADELRFWPYYALTGVLMGWLNWWIAIRPRRLLRAGESLATVPIIPSPLRAFVGVLITSLMAGPTVALLAFGAPIFAGSPVLTPLILGTAAFLGIFISLPAAVVNAALVSVLAYRRIDAISISVFSGGIVGGAVPFCVSLLGDERGGTAVAVKAGASSHAGFLLFAVTGAFMGVLYWLIAIRPKRQHRLAQEDASLGRVVQDAIGRERPRISLDDGIREAIERKRPRRVPWDGRIPPE